MVLLEAVRASNRTLRTTTPNPTALFVGGTSGIGQSTLRALAHNSEKPNVYIIGRSESNASPFLKELRQINANGNFNFIEADVSLIRNVDTACEEIKRKEKELNLVFMTPGGISLTGRRGEFGSRCRDGSYTNPSTETVEGLDHLFALRYYARMRFVANLMPLLESGKPARVISVFGGGFEGPINKRDLDLKRNFSVLKCALHSITMTSLAMEHLAATTKSKSLSFVHAYPGIVGTNIYTNSFPPPISTLYNYVMWPLMWPVSVNLKESGERHLFHATSARYPGRGGEAAGQGVPVAGGGAGVAKGSDGRVGSGAYLMNWKGETSVAGKTMQRYREEGMPEVVWRHTVDLLQSAVK